MKNNRLIAAVLAVAGVIPAAEASDGAVLALLSLNTIEHSFGFNGTSRRSSSDRREEAPTLPAANGSFDHCAQQFYRGVAPEVLVRDIGRTRALCFDGFAVMHSAARKIPLYTGERLNRARILAAKDEKRTDNFFEDARLPRAERATLEDYRGSGLDRGHNVPAADQETPEAMAQSFSLANMMPQARENNRKPWADIEKATRKYVLRARGDVYVITGSVVDPQYCPIHEMPQKPRRHDLSRCTIGSGVVVPSYLYKLVYDPSTNKAWAHWVANSDNARVGKPISYTELVRRTGIEFLPGVQPNS